MKYGTKANLNTKSCSDITEVDDKLSSREILIKKPIVAIKERSCSKYEKLPKSCRATCGLLVEISNDLNDNNFVVPLRMHF